MWYDTRLLGGDKWRPACYIERISLQNWWTV